MTQPETTTAREASTESLESLVGNRSYQVWVEMLARLGKGGRSHRLSVVVAAMLQYAAEVAGEKCGATPSEGNLAARLFAAVDWGDPEEILDSLRPTVAKLFEDAGVPHVRHGPKGFAYSFVEGSIDKFVHWHSSRGEET